MNMFSTVAEFAISPEKLRSLQLKSVTSHWWILPDTRPWSTKATFLIRVAGRLIQFPQQIFEHPIGCDRKLISGSQRFSKLAHTHLFLKITELFPLVQVIIMV
jgi:hypothetical protein